MRYIGRMVIAIFIITLTLGSIATAQVIAKLARSKERLQFPEPTWIKVSLGDPDNKGQGPSGACCLTCCDPLDKITNNIPNPIDFRVLIFPNTEPGGTPETITMEVYDGQTRIFSAKGSCGEDTQAKTFGFLFEFDKESLSKVWEVFKPKSNRTFVLYVSAKGGGRFNGNAYLVNAKNGKPI